MKLRELTEVCERRMGIEIFRPEGLPISEVRIYEIPKKYADLLDRTVTKIEYVPIQRKRYTERGIAVILSKVTE